VNLELLKRHRPVHFPKLFDGHDFSISKTKGESNKRISLLPRGARHVLGDPEQPIDEVLPAVFDRLWNDALRLHVETVFLGWVRTAISKSHRDRKVRPASPEVEAKPVPATEKAAPVGKTDSR